MIDVYDNVFELHDAQFVHHILTDQKFMWHYQHKSDKSQEIYHWHRTAGRDEESLKKNGFEWLIPMWDHVMKKYKFKERYNVDTFRRIYFNAHTHGVEPQPHIDDGDFTMIYYPILDWQKNWGGGTIVWDEHSQSKKEMPKDIDKHVEYVGNRLFVFPAKRLHQAMPVSRICFKLRSVIVFKCYIMERLGGYED
tara:strand:- start:436 stop:1017 length:582 start_codon:yes stop_codon:yes gene_type:complete